MGTLPQRIRYAFGQNGKHSRQGIVGQRMTTTEPGTGVAQTATRAGGLAGEFQRLTRLMEPEDARGHGDINVRLHDEERERDRGMSW